MRTQIHESSEKEINQMRIRWPLLFPSSITRSFLNLLRVTYRALCTLSNISRSCRRSYFPRRSYSPRLSCSPRHSAPRRSRSPPRSRSPRRPTLHRPLEPSMSLMENGYYYYIPDSEAGVTAASGSGVACKIIRHFKMCILTSLPISKLIYGLKFSTGNQFNSINFKHLRN